MVCVCVCFAWISDGTMVGRPCSLYNMILYLTDRTVQTSQWFSICLSSSDAQNFVCQTVVATWFSAYFMRFLMVPGSRPGVLGLRFLWLPLIYQPAHMGVPVVLTMCMQWQCGQNCNDVMSLPHWKCPLHAVKSIWVVLCTYQCQPPPPPPTHTGQGRKYEGNWYFLYMCTHNFANPPAISLYGGGGGGWHW